MQPGRGGLKGATWPVELWYLCVGQSMNFITFCCKRCSCKCFDVDIFICCSQKSFQGMTWMDTKCGNPLPSLLLFPNKLLMPTNGHKLLFVIRLATPQKHTSARILPFEEDETYLCVGRWTLTFHCVVKTLRGFVPVEGGEACCVSRLCQAALW